MGKNTTFSEENSLLSLDKPREKFLICIENDLFKKLKTWPSSENIKEGSHVLENAKKFIWKQIKNFFAEPPCNLYHLIFSKTISYSLSFSLCVDYKTFPCHKSGL